MKRNNQESQSESLLVEIVGTLLGLAAIGAIAWAILYIRRGMTDPKLIAVVLGCLAVAILGPKVLRAIQHR